jgi:hypothetical protein
MYPFITLDDETQIVHSHLIDENGINTVYVHFERPKENGFDTARCRLPTYEWVARSGFTADEMKIFETIVRGGAHLFYKYAEAGGMNIAKAV